MAQVHYRCSEHGVVEPEQTDSVLGHGRCPECTAPVACRIGEPPAELEG